MTTLSNSLHVISNKCHYKVPPNVSPEWVTVLANIFNAVQSSSPYFPENFSHSLVNFVLYGENVHIDAKMKSAWPLEYFFPYNNSAPELTPLLHTLYQSIHCIPASIVVRWAKILSIKLVSSRDFNSMTPPSGPLWPEVIALHMSGISLCGRLITSGYCSDADMALFESWLQSDNIDPEHLLVVLLTTDKRNLNLAKYLIALPDYADTLDKQLDTIRYFFHPEKLPNHHSIFFLLSRAHWHTLKRLLPELSALARSTDIYLKAATVEFIHRSCKAIPELMELAHDTQDESKPPTYAYPAIDWSTPETPTLKNLVSSMREDVHRSIHREHAKNQERSPSHYDDDRLKHEISLFDDNLFNKLLKHLDAPVPYRLETVEYGFQFRKYLGDCIKRFISHEAMTPVVLFKLLVFFNQLSDGRGLSEMAVDAFNLIYQQKKSLSLIELSILMEDSGNSGFSLIHECCENREQSLADGWNADSVWPYLAYHLVSINELMLSDFLDRYHINPAKFFFLISTLPSMPSTLATRLLSIGLGSIKRHRRAAQDALFAYKPKLPIIFSALRNKKSEARTIAAQWLNRLKEPSSLAPLENALKQEKNDIAKAAILDALEQLGQPLENYINRSVLIGEATRESDKLPPKELAWLPWASLPIVRWTDNNEPVAPAILHWLIVQAFKQKSPEPNSLIRKYCAMFDESTRHNFGNYIFEKWLDEDLRGDAMKIALEKAQYTARDIIKRPSLYKNNPVTSLSIEELIEHFLTLTLKKPAGSAIDSKGVLGLVAACADQTVVKPAAQYLKRWYGSRAAQGKAMIAMLAWIDHPSAIQFVLSIGNRFRTKSFQDEAIKHAEALADRNDWTLMQLADRSVPTAGFDERCSFEVDYGPRQFVVSLLPDLNVVLHTMDGKKITSLPTVSEGDDLELAKEAKKLFSAAKKDVKSITSMQTQQFYDACCIQREWGSDEWNQYLRLHPITGKLAEKLVWIFVTQDGSTMTFRPTEGGGLVDALDNDISLPNHARIRLAHSTVISNDSSQQWREHIRRHRVSPLFEQFNYSNFLLPVEHHNHIDINDFQSYILESFVLKGKASKLGYARGPALDGGWFYTYEKRFLNLHLKAVITFSGGALPEKNKPVSLINLCFMDINKTSSWTNTGYTLSRIPPVLLSECYNDLRIIAEAGLGFDPDWLKNNGFLVK